MTTTDDPVLDALARANPHPRESIPDAAEDARARTMLATITATPAPPRRSGRARIATRALVPAVSIVVVLAVVAIVLHASSDRHHSTTTTPGAAGQVVLKFQPPSPGAHVTSAAVGREIAVLRARLRAGAGLTGERFVRVGSDELVIRSAALAASGPLQRLLTDNPQIALTDWEANVISPDGRTAASQLLNAHYPPAQTLSQGNAEGPPGSRGAGAQTLYAAVRLASRQPTRPDAAGQTRQGPESFAFTTAGSAGCRSSAVPCWVAGPSPTKAAVLRQAQRDGVSHPIVLTVPQGTTVVQATGSATGTGADYRARTARFFATRDDAALTAADLRDASTANDQGQAAVHASFTAAGARAFQDATAAIAHRGRSLALGAQHDYQHFAIIDDSRIVEVPYINYNSDPDGIIHPQSPSFEITGNLTRASAQRIAQQLTLGTLPLSTQIVPPPAA